MDLLNPHATSGGGPLKPKDRLKMEAKRKKLMADKGNAKAAEEARDILRQLSPSYQGDKGPKVGEPVVVSCDERERERRHFRYLL